MRRAIQRRLASLRVRVAHMCFVARFRGINGTPWHSWVQWGEPHMSVDQGQEAGSSGEDEAVATLAASSVKTYAVAPGVRLNVRSGPGTSYNITRTLPEGTRVPIFCQTPGTTESGYYGTPKI